MITKIIRVIVDPKRRLGDGEELAELKWVALKNKSPNNLLVEKIRNLVELGSYEDHL